MVRLRHLFCSTWKRPWLFSWALILAASCGTNPGNTSAPVSGKTVPLDLAGKGSVAVTADVPARTEFEISLFDDPPADEPLAAMLTIDPEAIVVIESPTAKAQSADARSAGPTGQIKIRLVIGEKDLGPFKAGTDLGVIDATVVDGKVTAVKSEKTVPKILLNLLLTQVFSVGMEVLANFDGQVEVQSFNIDFGMDENDPDAPVERRACCFARNGPAQCVDIGFIDALRTVEDCATKFAGVVLGEGTTCADVPCESSEACCLAAGECDDAEPLACRQRGGTPQSGNTCADAECPTDAEEVQDCTANTECNTNCPDVEPDPDCSNADLCASTKKFCCPGDLICDVQRCNDLDTDCTNLIFCDRFSGCCDDDNVCDTQADGRACPEEDADCAFCGDEDEVCIRGCSTEDPDCPDTEDCPLDNRCELDCAGEDPDCALCVADALGTCVEDCETIDPDCLVERNITAEGTPSASSVFQDESIYLPIRATDGQSGTNWFSDGKGGDGPDSDSELFTWVYNLSGDTSITRIETDPETVPNGFGFLQVRTLVLNSAGGTVYESAALTQAGSLVDLNITLPEGAEGRTIELTLIIHEDASCGGFSEFRVFGLRE